MRFLTIILIVSIPVSSLLYSDTLCNTLKPCSCTITSRDNHCCCHTSTSHQSDTHCCTCNHHTHTDTDESLPVISVERINIKTHQFAIPSVIYDVPETYIFHPTGEKTFRLTHLPPHLVSTVIRS